MPLTPKQLKIVLNHFEEIGFKPECPMCGENNWEPDGILSLPVLSAKHDGVAEDVVVPVVYMTCNCCGYFIQFSAIKLGLVKPSAKS